MGASDQRLGVDAQFTFVRVSASWVELEPNVLQMLRGMRVLVLLACKGRLAVRLRIALIRQHHPSLFRPLLEP